MIQKASDQVAQYPLLHPLSFHRQNMDAEVKVAGLADGCRARLSWPTSHGGNLYVAIGACFLSFGYADDDGNCPG